MMNSELREEMQRAGRRGKSTNDEERGAKTLMAETACNDNPASPVGFAA